MQKACPRTFENFAYAKPRAQTLQNQTPQTQNQMLQDQMKFGSFEKKLISVFFVWSGGGGGFLFFFFQVDSLAVVNQGQAWHLAVEATCHRG